MRIWKLVLVILGIVGGQGAVVYGGQADSMKAIVFGLVVATGAMAWAASFSRHVPTPPPTEHELRCAQGASRSDDSDSWTC